MSLNKQQAKENLSLLIDRFEKELSSGRAKEYNEEATKISFILPFLKDALGWDITNQQEVSPEEKTSRGRVDFSLKIDGKIKAFIETKPVKADLEKHIEQAVRYGYNRKDVPFVLLTDFEGIKLFDVTIKPDVRNPLKGLKLDLSWNEYLKHFDKIWLLSKESVAKGELDKLLLVKPKDRLPVDKAILDDLKKWREILAKDIFKNNPKLFNSVDPEKNTHYLKEITQKILDRIIFMRFCKDRGLTQQRHLRETFQEHTDGVGINTMVFLNEKFKHYETVFNSDLFNYQGWQDNLAIDFKVMRSIILDTYNPYQFDVIPLEVLGNIYEQYLGYTIRLTEHYVKYELKPDVRKAGGVYYTPEYIVDYIVKNTVGKLLEGLRPNKVKKLRILDPACGSGSFLIKAYEEMLNYYQKQKKEQKQTDVTQTKLDLQLQDNQRRLNIYEKSEILRNHIFGVDIDEQAVEVTKLSLMLKMLEGEHGLVPGRAVLPMLDRNIRCGNSLISGDTLELKKYFGDDWYKVNPFDWNKEFSEIMQKQGGFDVVIGNPPWGSLLTSSEKRYLNEHYTNRSGEAESHLFFIERGFRLLNKTGLLGVITPNTWLSVLNSKGIREYLLKNSNFYEISELSKYIFKDAPDIVPILLFLTQNQKQKTCLIKKPKTTKVNAENFKDIFLINRISQHLWLEQPGKTINLQLTPQVIKVIEKCSQDSVILSEICEVLYGIKTGNNQKYLSNKKSKLHTVKTLKTGELSRYTINWKNIYLWWSSELAGYRTSSLEIPKIIIQYIRKLSLTRRIIAALDEKGLYYPLNNYSYILIKNSTYTLKYIIAIINSKLINFYFAKTFIDYNIKPTYLQQLPIHKIDFSDSLEKKSYDNLVSLADTMLDLSKKLQAAQGNEKEQIQHQIDKTDKEIDELVYKLYSITEEEKKIIEESR
ncbi:MAG: N-6 DNA methylase [Candidatus Omnitrophota bacterium]|nr:N-6 DNA methylase [Candidatus Omnitrophota bacterium]